MIDVHVLISDDTPDAWLFQCIESIHEAMKQAGFPVVLHLIDAVKGHIGEGRSSGYAQGVQPYVTSIDDDDYVLPFAFQQMRSSLALGTPCVCTPEQTLQNGQLRAGAKRHHLIAFRRDLIIDHRPWICCGDIAQLSAIPDDAIDLPRAAYVHRIYMSSKARVMRRTHAAEVRRSRG